MTLCFKPIDLDRDFQICQEMRAISYLASYGSLAGFSRDYGETYRHRLAEKLARLPQVCCHIWLGDTIVGQTEGSLIQDESVGYVNLIAIKENHQRRGFGHLTVQYLSHTFRDLGKSRLQLSVSNTNQLALAFYAKTGWQNLGLRPNSSQMFLMEKCL